MYNNFISHVKKLYPGKDFIPLHEPVMGELEKKYLSDCIDSTFVSSVGKYVEKFEERICKFTKAKYAIATTNGTSALHATLVLMNVLPGDEVLTQALTFVATANAISYCGANPIFVDSSKENFGMCPVKLEEFLFTNTFMGDNGDCINKVTGKIIKACVPMHVFGRPVSISKIKKICDRYKISLIEDAAEGIGSFVSDQHVGLSGDFGILSFNGNKVITSGGGGMIITNDEALAKKAKHITTTAKVSHPYEFNHDLVGYNYRLPNLNASFACAQMERLQEILHNKRETAIIYKEFFQDKEAEFIEEEFGTISNYWLNAILLKDRKERDIFLKETNDNGVMTRPVWKLMSELNIFSKYQKTNLDVCIDLQDRVVNIPSGFRG